MASSFSDVSAYQSASASQSHDSFGLSTESSSQADSPSSSTTLRIPFYTDPNTAYYNIGLPDSLCAIANQLRGEFLSKTIQLDSSNPVYLACLFLTFLTKYERQDGIDDDVTKVIGLVLADLQTNLLEEESFHSALTSLAIPHAAKLDLIRTFLDAHRITGFDLSSDTSFPLSPFAQAIITGGSDFKAYGVFGGQGSDPSYFNDLHQTFTTYQAIIGSLVEQSSYLLQQLSSLEEFSEHFSHGFDVVAWLNDPGSRPSDAYLLQAPLSFPLIGLLQMMHYKATSILMGCDPKDMQQLLSGVTGHSQGLVVAAVVAAATSWPSFDAEAAKALRVLFHVGVRAQSVCGITLGHQLRTKDAKEEMVPTPMLSIRTTASREVLVHIVLEFNKALPRGAPQVELSLFNDGQTAVATGPPSSLRGLATVLESKKAKGSQVKTPFSKRRPEISYRFLEVSAAFHNSYLTDIASVIENDCADIRILARSLLIPVYSTDNGSDLAQEDPDTDVVPRIIRLITCEVVNWPAAVEFPGATHVVDFGLGGSVGTGSLISRIKEGSGTRVILASLLDGPNKTFGYQSELFSHLQPPQQAWKHQYAPSVKTLTAGQKNTVDTKLSRLLGLPHVMVAAMTPTTSSPEFVVAVMEAGYHVELATGGFSDSEALSAAISHIARNTQPGRGITCNIIYANPRSLGWIIPTLQRLREVDQLPIEGLSIGAGIPSVDVIKGYIDSLRLKHISLKPGSAQSIREVLKIASALPDVPIILQWTGGRGGGHHSQEDFHQPVLQTYAEIRRHRNVILVAGSGFGDAQGTLPYLTGTWSLDSGVQQMPFDGILLGSRVMVAKEAKTSTAVKNKIVETPGVDDAEWEQSSYRGPGGGGICSVKSEMGEAIHKIATRGVRLWAEFDQSIFCLDKKKRLEKIQQTRQYIILRLNADFQKVWFGHDRATGKPAELEDMTYADVLRRLIDLTYMVRERRWTHSSWRTLVHDVGRRTMARLLAQEPTSAAIIAEEAWQNPETALASLLALCPAAQDTFMCYEDVQYFLWLCGRKGQKPVPFIPVLDENLETWFKKDSLWQSENIEAVYGQDVGRVCILHGPVAAQYSTVVNEPVREILDSIHDGHADSLQQLQAFECDNNLPRQPLSGSWSVSDDESSGICTTPDDDQSRATPDSDQCSSEDMFFVPSRHHRPSLKEWIAVLSLSKYSQLAGVLKDALSLDTDQQIKDNPIRQLVKSMTKGCRDPLIRYHIGELPCVHLSERRARQPDVQVLSISPCPEHDGIILAKALENRSIKGCDVTLELRYSSHPHRPFAPIVELDCGRIARIRDFYHQIWFGEPLKSRCSIRDKYTPPGQYTVTRDSIMRWKKATGAKTDWMLNQSSDAGRAIAPLDFGIVIGWKALMQPLFAQELDVDFLRLLHLSNEFTNIHPIREGDTLTCESEAWAVTNRKAGTFVEMRARILRDDEAVIEMISQFLFRGTQCDPEHTFERKLEPPTEVALGKASDVAVLRSKSWIFLDEPKMDLVGKTVVFRLETLSSGFNGETTQQVQTSGTMEVRNAGKTAVKIGVCRWSNTNPGVSNPVTGYLSRHGRVAESPQLLQTPIPLFAGEIATIKAPDDNQEYAGVSGDFNPIHISDVFANLAGNPAPIAHGMHISTRVRQLAEERLCLGSSNKLGCDFRRFRCDFTGMVLPGSTLDVQFVHIGMLEGRKIVRVEATDHETHAILLKAECDVEVGHTAYVFTGQGSQFKGIGMTLYESSAAAREVWDEADNYFLEQYGFRITDIVRNDPKSIKVSFKGAHGRRVRANYMAFTFDTISSDGLHIQRSCFPDIDEATTSYTFRSEKGVLSLTQFTQPALILMEKAIVADLRSHGLVSSRGMYAGHSLGEFGALFSIANIMSPERTLGTLFYRGMIMHSAVDRLSPGCPDYGMCAVDPSRVSDGFDEKMLGIIVHEISRKTTWLLEIVNYNVAGQQYVCAGDIRALCSLTTILNTAKATSTLDEILSTTQKECARCIQSSVTPKLRRGRATIPLAGIDVPFHSSHLSGAVPSFRKFLSSGALQAPLQKMVGRYVPNLTARPFEISRLYFEDVLQRTGSSVVRNVLDMWDELNNAQHGEEALQELQRRIATEDEGQGIQVKHGVEVA